MALGAKARIEVLTSTRHLTIPDKTPSKQPGVGFCRVLSNCQVVKEKTLLRVQRSAFPRTGHSLKIAE